jgi:hypothetical protein
LADGEFTPSKANLAALRVGSMAAPHCLKSLRRQNEDALGAVDSATSLLSQYIGQKMKLHPATLISLTKSTGMLFCCTLIRYEPANAVTFPIKLLYAFENSFDLYSSRDLNQVKGVIGVLLTTFALSQHDYPGWKKPPPLDHMSRAERAIELNRHYTSLIGPIDDGTTSSLLYFGLLSLLSHSAAYNLADCDYEVIAKTLGRLPYATDRVIHTLPAPPAFNLARQTMDAVHLRLSDPSGLCKSEAVLGAHLQALWNTHQVYQRHAQTGRVYVFLIESFCQTQKQELRNLCFNLLAKFPLPDLSDTLAEIATERNIISLLLSTLESEDITAVMFSMSQLCVLATLVLRSGSELHAARQILLSPLLNHTGLSNLDWELRYIRHVLVTRLIYIQHGLDFNSEAQSHYMRVTLAWLFQPQGRSGALSSETAEVVIWRMQSRNIQ